MRSISKIANMMMEMYMYMCGMCMTLRAKISDMFSIAMVGQCAR